jgi:hypothetical protein
MAHEGSPRRMDAGAAPAARQATSLRFATEQLTAAEREEMIEAMITSQAYEGVHISRRRAEELLDEVLREPLLDLD